eukprot:2266164-Rhodomonas_salina.1
MGSTSCIISPSSAPLSSRCLDHGVLTWNRPVMRSDKEKLGEDPRTNGFAKRCEWSWEKVMEDHENGWEAK